MAITTTDILNMALSRLGSNILADLSNTNDPATLAFNRFYDPMRQLLLEAFAWRFAQKRAALVVAPNVTRDGWRYVYNLPADFNSVDRVWDGGSRPEAPGVAYSIEAEATGTFNQQVLCTDQPSAVLFYTYDHTTPAVWPMHFVNALAWRLAAEMAMPLSVEPARARLAFDFAGQELNKAIVTELNRLQHESPQPAAPQIRARQ